MLDRRRNSRQKIEESDYHNKEMHSTYKKITMLKTEKNKYDILNWNGDGLKSLRYILKKEERAAKERCEYL